MECLDPVEADARWWDWRTWEECGQELGDLESKVPVSWMAAARAGRVQPLGAGRHSPVGEASLNNVGRAAWIGGGRVTEFTIPSRGEYSVRLGSALQYYYHACSAAANGSA
jgi:hypothetical protein